MTAEQFERFIANRRWKTASTAPKNPHAYTAKVWKPEERAEFEQAVQYIYGVGCCLRFGRTTYRVLVIDGLRYWAMAVQDPDVTKPQVLNRAVHTATDEKRCAPCPERHS